MVHQALSDADAAVAFELLSSRFRRSLLFSRRFYQALADADAAVALEPS